MTVISHATMMERELEAKVDAHVAALIASGVNPSDITEEQMEQMCHAAWQDLSPHAKRKAGEDGVLLAVTQVMGERLAEKLFSAGTGWDVSDEDLKAIATELRIEPTEAKGCLAAFRHKAKSVTAQDISEWRTLARFAPLFLDQPSSMSLAAAAESRAISGDTLAMSFLSWRELA